MNVLFWVARHGTTDDTKRRIFRGDRNSKLDHKGFLDAHELKNFFSSLPWSKIIVSTMDRSGQTARTIANGDESRILGPFSDLDPWDIGYLAGKERDDYQDDMKVFVDNPDMRPAGGEMLQEFRGRIIPVFLQLIELGFSGEHDILVGHSSVIHVLSDLLNGVGSNIDVQSGGAIEVYCNKKGQIKARVIFKPGEDDSSFAGS
jgi:broad specificity phosphatase PhoE